LLLTHAHAIFTHLEHAESDLSAFRRGDAGTVRLGSFSSGIGSIAVPVMEQLASGSRLHVQIREVESEGLPDALLGRTVDLGLSLSSGEPLPEDDDPRLAVEHLMDDTLDIALPVDHPLASRTSIEPAGPLDSIRRCGTTPTSSPGSLRSSRRTPGSD
jgi:DNA-binding transcriptional LysR family regulator